MPCCGVKQPHMLASGRCFTDMRTAPDAKQCMSGSNSCARWHGTHLRLLLQEGCLRLFHLLQQLLLPTLSAPHPLSCVLLLHRLHSVLLHNTQHRKSRRCNGSPEVQTLAHVQPLTCCCLSCCLHAYVWYVQVTSGGYVQVYTWWRMQTELCHDAAIASRVLEKMSRRQLRNQKVTCL